MVVAEDDEFTFTWCIQNFSHSALIEGGILESPKFEVGFFNAEFCLNLYPRGKYPGYISCYLCRKKRDFEFPFRFSILKSNGLFEEKNIVRFFEGLESKEGFIYEIDLQEFTKPNSSYIDNDTLTIRCQLWKKETKFPVSIQCYAHTKIKVSKLLYTWTLNDIFELEYPNQMNRFTCTKIPSFSSNLPSLKIQLLNREASYFDDDTIYLVVKISAIHLNYLLVYGIHLLDADGNVAHSLTGKHLFENTATEQSVDFPFLSKRKLLLNQKLYLPNNKLTFQCEFYISSDDPETVVETFEYRKKDDLKMKPIPTNQILEENKLWKKNMHKLLEAGEFSDFAVSTPTRQFPVHRAILCTQSEVFTAMLKHNMKEKNSSVVEIEDLEDDIISKMLMYLYTNTLDDIDVPSALKLYYTADKYRITTLQKSCSGFLMRNIDVSNAAEILVLADTHQDQDLKSSSSAFILEHVLEVINSENWKNIMATHGHLTSQIMQEIICKKLFDTKFAL